jgi:hypothetical protein
MSKYCIAKFSLKTGTSQTFVAQLRRKSECKCTHNKQVYTLQVLWHFVHSIPCSVYCSRSFCFRHQREGFSSDGLAKMENVKCKGKW